MGDFDSLLEELGFCGPFQRRLYTALCLLSLTTGVCANAVVFMMALPSHRCHIPSYNNDTYEVQSDYHHQLINSSIPADMVSGRLIYDQCNMMENGSTSQPCNRWVYDKTHFKATAVTEMDLVCDSKVLRSLVVMLQLGGNSVGAIIVTALSDLFGRKRVLLISVIFTVICGFGMAWLPEIVTLCLVVFFHGVFSYSTYMCNFIIAMELTMTKKRYLIGTYLIMAFGAGECLVAVVGYFLRDRNLTLTALYIVPALLLICFWIIPESPRWLAQKGRIEEVAAIVDQIAKVNGKAPPDERIDKLDKDTHQKGAMTALFRSWALAWRFSFLCFNWFAVSMPYYGLNILSMDTVGNPYLNLFLFSLVEVPAGILNILLLKKIGRKVVLCSAMFFGGSACISTLLPLLLSSAATTELILALQLIGKFGSTITYNTLYIFTSELLPTVARSRGMGVCGMFSRASSLIAPYIAHMGGNVAGPVGVVFPVVLFGAMTIVAGFLNLFLPETRHKPLPDTISDLQLRLVSKRRQDRIQERTEHEESIPL